MSWQFWSSTGMALLVWWPGNLRAKLSTQRWRRSTRTSHRHILEILRRPGEILHPPSQTLTIVGTASLSLFYWELSLVTGPLWNCSHWQTKVCNKSAMLSSNLSNNFENSMPYTYGHNFDFSHANTLFLLFSFLIWISGNLFLHLKTLRMQDFILCHWPQYLD